MKSRGDHTFLFVQNDKRSFPHIPNFSNQGFPIVICCHETGLHGEAAWRRRRVPNCSNSLSPSFLPSFGASSIKTQLQAPKQSCRHRTLLLIPSPPPSRAPCFSPSNHQSVKSWLKPPQVPMNNINMPQAPGKFESPVHQEPRLTGDHTHTHKFTTMSVFPMAATNLISCSKHLHPCQTKGARKRPH